MRDNKDHHQEEHHMYEQFRYGPAAIQRAADGIDSSPYGVIEDILEDVLFLGALALRLTTLVYPAGWVADYQDDLLARRDGGHSFFEVAAHAESLAAATVWTSQFCAAVYPDVDEDEAKGQLVDYVEELEHISLSQSKTLDVCFVAHAFLLTDPKWRGQLLKNLAAQD
jgi:hypothetical protein